MTPEWDGKLKRKDDSPDSIPVRLAILEKCAQDTERRHKENKECLASIQERISGVKEDFRQALSLGIDAIVDKTDAQTKALTEKMDEQVKAYNDRSNRITVTETCIKWVERAGYLMGLWLVSVSAWIFHHSHKVK